MVIRKRSRILLTLWSFLKPGGFFLVVAIFSIISASAARFLRIPGQPTQIKFYDNSFYLSNQFQGRVGEIQKQVGDRKRREEIRLVVSGKTRTKKVMGRQGGTLSFIGAIFWIRKGLSSVPYVEIEPREHAGKTHQLIHHHSDGKSIEP